MTIVCFSGPSLPPSEVVSLFPEAISLPPAAQGDVYRACLDHSPRAVCLIDGYFEHQPAVTHKELLWALSSGVAVYGAASMGALRAVELAQFGMIGFGAVYDLYIQGEVEDDDEVAVLHASAEYDFRTQSEALVNLRSWLGAARQHGILSSDDAHALVGQLKQCFYADRTRTNLLQLAGAVLPEQKLRAFARYLEDPQHRADLKRGDAIALLEHVRELWTSHRLPGQPAAFELAETDAWVNIKAAVHEARTPASDNLRDLVEEVQLAGPQLFAEVIRIATWRALCARLQVPALESGDLPATPLDDATIARISPAAQREVLTHVPAALKALGELDRLTRRADAKRAILESQSREREGQRDAAHAVERYFADNFDMTPPADLHTYAMHTGFSSIDSFIESILRDRQFVERASHFAR